MSITLTEEDKKQLQEKGYIIIKKFYSKEDIISMRKVITNVINKHHNIMDLGNQSGSKPDFIRDSQYKNMIPLLRINDIHKVMAQIFNAPFHFCFHNDIGINRIVNWHKDTLNNQYKVYQKKNLWLEYEGEKHEIYKFLIYLQDHSNNKNGLQLIEGSHLDPIINVKNNEIKQIYSNIGDIVIFDQRITHRGQYNQDMQFDRILVSLGFGKNNIFTKEFEEGTIRRQNDQNKIIRKKF